MVPISKENFKFQRKIKINFQGFLKINSSKRRIQISKSKKNRERERERLCERKRKEKQILIVSEIDLFGETKEKGKFQIPNN